MRRFFRMGRAVTLLLARLVLANLAQTLTPRERDLNPAALVRPAQPRSPDIEWQTARTVAELLHALATDEGCASPATTHAACAAAAALASRAPDSIAVQRALEETVIMARRAPCVRRAAVDALAMLDSHTAGRALRRMQSVTARRVEWEGRVTDRDLLQRLVTVLEGSAAITKH